MLAELNVPPSRRAPLLVGVAVAVAAHVGLAAYAMTREQDEPVVEIDRVVELFDAPAPPPPEPPPVVEKPASPTPTPMARQAPARAEPPPPAQASQVVAAEASADPAEPVDFTMAQGQAAHYAGGVTAGNGTNSVATAVGPTKVGAAPGVAGATRIDRSSPVRLDARRWECPWPEQAEAEAIELERVTIRVTVRADGSVESAQIVEDPGRGFGAAALACARRGRGFVAARDPRGEAVRAESPPIRVTFTR